MTEDTHDEDRTDKPRSHPPRRLERLGVVELHVRDDAAESARHVRLEGERLADRMEPLPAICIAREPFVHVDIASVNLHHQVPRSDPGRLRRIPALGCEGPPIQYPEALVALGKGLP